MEPSTSGQKHPEKGPEGSRKPKLVKVTDSTALRLGSEFYVTCIEGLWVSRPLQLIRDLQHAGAWAPVSSVSDLGGHEPMAPIMFGTV